MSEVLARWNRLPVAEATNEILPCCGSTAWAHRMAAARPFSDPAKLLAVSDETWHGLAESDWREAFQSHPRIGESGAPPSAPAQSAAWSAEEQGNVAAAPDQMKVALAEGNRAYERRFRHIFIACAAGKSAPEILEILKRRLQNDQQTELREAAEQQRQITHIRLKKWLWG
jgi:2-oxo-4-hydroxy-4-carboxy-5-ureidoimidazoline decarboxylase